MLEAKYDPRSSKDNELFNGTFLVMRPVGLEVFASEPLL